MLDSMRKPVFLTAVLAMALAVLVEFSSVAWLGSSSPSANALKVSVTGHAISSLPLLDGLILYALVVIALALLIPERVQSKVQGIVTAIVSALLLAACIARIFVNINLLSLMLGLLLAVPFGTPVYLVLWGQFNTTSASHVLSLLMALKLTFAVCLVVAQQRFLQNKGLVLIILCSFGVSLLVTFLYGFVPGFLVSIADVIAAIVICVIAAIWMVIYFTGAIISIIKVIL